MAAYEKPGAAVKISGGGLKRQRGDRNLVTCTVNAEQATNARPAAPGGR